ncbi:MAG: hypothetical protein AAF492_32095, partial [Verrucomicrobiota bacterium]
MKLTKRFGWGLLALVILFPLLNAGVLQSQEAGEAEAEADADTDVVEASSEQTQPDAEAPAAPARRTISAQLSLSLAPDAEPSVTPSDEGLTVVPNGTSGTAEERTHHFKIEGFKSKGESASVTVTANGTDHTYPTETLVIIPRAEAFTQTLTGEPNVLSAEADLEPGGSEFALEAEFWFADWERDGSEDLDGVIYGIRPQYFFHRNASLEGMIRLGDLDDDNDFYEAELSLNVYSDNRNIVFSGAYRFSKFEFADEMEQETHATLMRGEINFDLLS